MLTVEYQYGIILSTLKGRVTRSMDFMSMRDLRTQAKQIWDKLEKGEEIVLTNNGRPRAFIINIPEGFFDEMLSGIRQAKARIKPQLTPHADYEQQRERFKLEHTSEEMNASWQGLRTMLTVIDGGSIDLNQERMERRAAKYERND